MKKKGSDPYIQSIVLFTLSGSIALSVAFIFNKFELPPLPQMPYLILGAVTALIGTVCLYKAYKIIEASEVTILSSSQRLWSVLGAFIFLGEPFSYMKIAATFIIILGVTIASWKKHSGKWGKGATFVLTAAFLFSISDIAGYFLLNYINPVAFTGLTYLLPAIILIIYKAPELHKITFYTRPSNFWKIILAASLDAFGAFSFFYAYTLGRNVSVITPLLGTRIIVTVILAALILGERENIHLKIIGASIIILGSLILFI